MGKNLSVGNTPFSTTEDQLREAFSQYGTVTKVQVIMDRETGRPRGFAFVEMSDGGDQAIAALNGAQLDGRALTVNEAKPGEGAGRGSTAGVGTGTDGLTAGCRVPGPSRLRGSPAEALSRSDDRHRCARMTLPDPAAEFMVFEHHAVPPECRRPLEDGPPRGFTHGCSHTLDRLVD